MTGTAATGGPPRPAPDLPNERRSEVKTVNTTDLLVLQPAGIAVPPRPKAALAPDVVAPVCPVTSAAYSKTTGTANRSDEHTSEFQTLMRTQSTVSSLEKI